MEIKQIKYSSRFVRALKKLPAQEKQFVDSRIKIFQKNYFDPRLKTHKLTGRLKGYWSFSITYSHRVLFEFSGRAEVGFIDVGDHSIYE